MYKRFTYADRIITMCTNCARLTFFVHANEIKKLKNDEKHIALMVVPEKYEKSATTLCRTVVKKKSDNEKKIPENR